MYGIPTISLRLKRKGVQQLNANIKNKDKRKKKKKTNITLNLKLTIKNFATVNILLVNIQWTISRFETI